MEKNVERLKESFTELVEAMQDVFVLDNKTLETKCNALEKLGAFEYYLRELLKNYEGSIKDETIKK